METVTGNTFAGTYNYTYDEANRLKTVAGPAAFGSRTYDYDGGGNRTSVQVNANPAITTTYNAASLPVSSSDGTSYSHDPVGDLTAIDRTGSSNDWFFTYSSWNQLTKAERSPGSADVTYTLDALDRVLSRASTGATSQYTYQGSGEVLAKSVVAGSTTTYAHTPGGPLAQKIGNTKRYYLRDLHGDLVGWSDTNGALQGTALYDPWGELLSGTGDMATVPTNGAFRFQSDPTDSATGQVDMGARYYESALGRFSSRDLLFGEPTNPLSLNQHVYTAANPITLWDPTGLCADPDVCPPQIGFGTTETHSVSSQAVAQSHSTAQSHPTDDADTIFLTRSIRVELAAYYSGCAGSWCGTTGAHDAVRDQLKDEVCGGTLFVGEHICEPEFPIGAYPGDRRRADLVDLTSFEVYEVKPDKPNQISRGARQVAGYVDELNRRFGGEDFDLASDFEPFSVNYRGHTLNVRWARPGVAAYKPSCAPNCDPNLDLDRATLIWRIQQAFRWLSWVPEVVPVPVPV